MLSSTMLLILVAICTACMQNQHYNGSTPAKIPALLLPQSGSAIDDIDYIFEADTSSLPKEASVFKFKQVDITDSDVHLIASKFGLQGKAKLSPGGQYGLRDGNCFLMVDKHSGKYLFIDESLTDFDIITGSVKLPSDEEVVTIAKNYLQNLGLLREDFVSVGLGEITTGPDTNSKVIAKKVFFYRQLDNQPVLGVSRIVVTVGHNGEIASVDKLFKEVSEVYKYPLRPIDEAMVDVRNNKGKTDLDEQSRIAKINKVEVMYWEDAGSVEDQPYIQPVYRFEGDVVKDDGTVDKFHVVVSAIDTKYVKKPLFS